MPLDEFRSTPWICTFATPTRDRLHARWRSVEIMRGRCHSDSRYECRSDRQLGLSWAQRPCCGGSPARQTYTSQLRKDRVAGGRPILLLTATRDTASHVDRMAGRCCHGRPRAGGDRKTTSMACHGLFAGARDAGELWVDLSACGLWAGCVIAVCAGAVVPLSELYTHIEWPSSSCWASDDPAGGGMGKLWRRADCRCAGGIDPRDARVGC